MAEEHYIERWQQCPACGGAPACPRCGGVGFYYTRTALLPLIGQEGEDERSGRGQGVPQVRGASS